MATASEDVAETVGSKRSFCSSGRCRATCCPFHDSKRSNALSMVSGDGWTYRCETVTLLWPAIRMIVNASAPASPNRVSIVCLSECSTKSAVPPTLPPSGRAAASRTQGNGRSWRGSHLKETSNALILMLQLVSGTNPKHQRRKQSYPLSKPDARKPSRMNCTAIATNRRPMSRAIILNAVSLTKYRYREANRRT